MPKDPNELFDIVDIPTAGPDKGKVTDVWASGILFPQAQAEREALVARGASKICVIVPHVKRDGIGNEVDVCPTPKTDGPLSPDEIDAIGAWYERAEIAAPRSKMVTIPCATFEILVAMAGLWSRFTFSSGPAALERATAPGFVGEFGAGVVRTEDEELVDAGLDDIEGEVEAEIDRSAVQALIHDAFSPPTDFSEDEIKAFWDHAVRAAARTQTPPTVEQMAEIVAVIRAARPVVRVDPTRADGALTAGPPPDGRSVDEHLDELAHVDATPPLEFDTSDTP